MRQTDPLQRSMEIYKGRSVNDEGNQSILEKYPKSCNPSRQLQSTQLIEIKGERGRIEQTNSERTRRWNSRRSEERRFEMDQSMFCCTKTGKRKMEKNYRLQDSQQTYMFQSLHHGRHTYTTRFAKAQRLDDKNRLGISISPYIRRHGILTIPRIYSQQHVLLVQGDVFRGEACTIDLSQNSTTGNQIDQRSAQSSHSGVLRRYNYHPRRQVEIRINRPEHHQHFDKLWVENINQKVNTRTNLLDNVSRMGNQHGEGPVDDDNRKIEQNQLNDCKMEESCLKRNTGQNQIPSEFHWITKLPSASNHVRWTPYEEIKQSQDLYSTVQGQEQRIVPQSQYLAGNLLVESRSGQEKTNISNNCLTTSDPINRCINQQLGCMPEASESRKTDYLSGRVGQQLEVEQWQSERSSRYSLRVTTFRSFLKSKVSAITEDRNRQQISGIQHQPRGSSCSSSETGGSNSRYGRKVKHSTARVSHPKSSKQNSGLIEQISYFGRLHDRPRNTERSTSHSESKTYNRHGRQSKESQIQEIRVPRTRQQGCSSRQSFSLLEGRSIISPSTNTSDIGYAVQIRQRECECSDGSSQLAVTSMVAKHDEQDKKMGNCGKKRRRVESWRQNEEIEETLTARRNDSRVIGENKGEELFRLVLKQRGLTDTVVQKVIDGWHTIWGRHRQRSGQIYEYWASLGKEKEELLYVEDPEIIIVNFIAQLGEEKSTDSNQTNCRTAICMLFKLQGIQCEKINGVALHQIMKKPQTAMRKERKEELVFKLDITLRYLQQQFELNQELDEQKHLGCTVASIMAFSTLRLAEIHRASLTKEQKGAWSLHTPKYKGIGVAVSLTFHPLLNKAVCPTTWVSPWLTRRNRQNEEQPLWWLPSKKKIESYEKMSKAVHMVMNSVGIEKKETMTSIRKSAITKGIDQGATKYEIDRFSMHADGSGIIQGHYDRNLNDRIRERLSNFE
ncbi:MAG: hypothetical protein EZS28_000385 [Streblomastix strix]|uniref:Tyr recombinase domain-containing protein n=1 Tax=Streblomastix strix TaxID=222440 RepID=A0A5J4XAE8_9EUKA|nr:MAG: hypothetical protein EZS28_000385 [Streblomastix strix]